MAWRHVLTALIAALGLITIVGSGGGGFSDGNVGGPTPPTPAIDPARVTVQVGATVTLTVTSFGTPPNTYQWQRDGVDLAGATGTSFTLAGVNLTDDGVRFSVNVSNSVGHGTASSLLHVSSMPAVVYQDTEFLAADWTSTATTDPVDSGATHSESQSDAQGNPGAARLVTYQTPPGPNSIRIFHTALRASYDPATQGAIYTLDLTRDCIRLNTSTLSETHASPAFEQGGRWFASRQVDWSCNPAWQRGRLASAADGEFELVAGPACGAHEVCPDLSAHGAPLHFGFTSDVNLPAGAAAGSIMQGIDNWQVTVWRR